MIAFISNELEPLAYFIYMVAVLLYYNHCKLFRYKVLVLYYAGAAIVLYAGIVIQTFDNNWSYNLLYLAKICVLSWYFRQLLHNKLHKKIVTVCLFINLLIFVYYNVGLHSFYSNFNSFVYGVVFITLIVYSLFYLYQILADVKEENLLLNFDFWLISGYLLHFLGSFVVVIYYEGADIYKRAGIWSVQNIILFICAVIILVAGLKIIRNQTTPPNG